MSRSVRMILLVLCGPAILTVGFSVAVFGAMSLAGQRYSREQIETGVLFFFACWQGIAIWWLWKNWKNTAGNDRSDLTKRQ